MADHETEHHEGGAEGGEHGGHAKGGHGHGGGGHGGGGHEEHEAGAPEWLISFADNVMLQMGFFVILLALNMGEKAKGPVTDGDGNSQPSNAMTDFAIAMREAFNNPVDLNSSDPQDQALIRRIKEKAEGSRTEDGPAGDKQDMQSLRPSDYTNTVGVVEFERGESDIPFEGAETIFEVAKRVSGHRFIVEVRGNCSAAEAAQSDDRGMMLSYERALAVAKQLETDGVNWRQLRVVAGGDSQRATGRASGAGQHRSNQRVEMIQTEETMPDDPYSQEGRGGDGG